MLLEPLPFCVGILIIESLGIRHRLVLLKELPGRHLTDHEQSEASRISRSRSAKKAVVIRPAAAPPISPAKAVGSAPLMKFPGNGRGNQKAIRTSATKRQPTK